MNQVYEKIDVWMRGESCIKIYNCFRSISTKHYYVQSCDQLYEPFDSKQSDFMARNTLELFHEEPVDERAEGYECLVQAIIEFDKSFSDDFE